MDNEINNRILLIINELFNGNVSAFSRAVSVKQPTLNTIIGERKSKPSFEVIHSIANASALNISIDWLITGKGDMLKKDIPASHTSATVHGSVKNGIVGGIGNVGGNVNGNGNKLGIIPADCEKKLIRAQIEIDYLKKEIKSLKDHLKEAIEDKDKAMTMLYKSLDK